MYIPIVTVEARFKRLGRGNLRNEGKTRWLIEGRQAKIRFPMEQRKR
jgi:hypothetical protein